MKNAKIYVLKHSLNLFGIKWIQLFNWWNKPISILCRNIFTSVESSNAVERLKQKFTVKQSGTHTFKSKWYVPFVKKFPKIKGELWKKVVVLWLRLHTDVVGPLNSPY